MYFADDFVVDDSLTFCYFLVGEFAANIFRFGINSWLFLFHLVWCAQIYLELSESSFLVNWLGSNFPCLLFLFLDLAQRCRACFRFYSIFAWILWLFVSRGARAVSFLVLFGLFRFVGT